MLENSFIRNPTFKPTSFIPYFTWLEQVTFEKLLRRTKKLLNNLSYFPFAKEYFTPIVDIYNKRKVLHIYDYAKEITYTLMTKSITSDSNSNTIISTLT